MNEDEFQERLMDMVGRHFVALKWTDRTPGARQDSNAGFGEVMIASGFIVSVQGQWFFITAGHIVSDIEKAIALGQVFQDWELHDTATSMAVSELPVPFDYRGSVKFSYCRDGADYALIHIRTAYIHLLKANGIVPVSENEWGTNLPIDFDLYLLAGIPKETLRVIPDREYQYSIYFKSLTPMVNPPNAMVRPFSRFYAKLPPVQYDGGGDVFDIDGMSGGPIFGFKLFGNQYKYWIHSIQSSWMMNERIVATCTFKIFGEWISDEVVPLLAGDSRSGLSAVPGS